MENKNLDVKSVNKDIEALGPWRIAWNRFKKNKIAMAGTIIFIAIVLLVLFVPVISGIDLNHYDLPSKNLAPSGAHILGTDAQGRDVLFRLFYGGRISIMVGVIAAACTVVLGIIIGGVAGFYGGWVDNLLMRFTEIVY